MFDGKISFSGRYYGVLILHELSLHHFTNVFNFYFNHVLLGPPGAFSMSTALIP